ncbi:MAG: LuxR C-terminal-related transcriptional regulator [Acidimicrobiales bacterium]
MHNDTNVEFDEISGTGLSRVETEAKNGGEVRRTAILGAPSPFQTGLSAILREAPNIELVGDWSHATSGPAIAAGHRADVAILDLDVWGADGIERLCSGSSSDSAPPIPILAVTSSEDVEASSGALYAGARGVLLKDAHPDEFVRAVHSVGGGAVVLAPHLVAWLLEEVLRTKRREDRPGPAPGDVPIPGTAAVTPRQREVLALLASGLSNAEIAEHLAVSKPTVKSHVSALLRTFDVCDRTKLALLANQIYTA